MTKEEFLARISPEPNSGCWLWTGAMRSSGYGNAHVDGRFVSAHRFAYECANGPVEDDCEVMHTCHMRLCCNPQHLMAGSHAENMRQAKERGSMSKLGSYCSRGHKMTAANTLLRPNGARRCRACHRELARNNYRDKAGIPTDAPVRKWTKGLNQTQKPKRPKKIRYFPKSYESTFKPGKG